MTVWIALWYSVTVTKDRRVTRSDLIAIAARAGLQVTRTVLATGNVIFTSEGARGDLESRLETATEHLLGRHIPVFCRTETEWRELVADNPFPTETQANPAQVGVRVMRQMPGQDVITRIAAAAGPDEKFQSTSRALWIATPAGLSAGKLLAAAGARWAGEGTFRNASSIAKVAAALP